MTAADGEQDAVQVQVRGTVLTVRKVDAYYAMTVVAPGIAARFRPGQFVAVAVGGPDTFMLLRRFTRQRRARHPCGWRGPLTECRRKRAARRTRSRLLAG